MTAATDLTNFSDFTAALPARITLDDLAAMAVADENHRYELSAEGVLQVMSPPTFEHQQITTRVILWLAQHGYKADQIVATPGVHTGSDNRSGGRQPDLTIWPEGFVPVKAFSEYVVATEMIAAVEIVSPSSRTIDKSEKRHEYAAAKIRTYVVVDDDPAHTVTVYRLASGRYEIATRVNLQRLLEAYDPKELFD